MADNFNLRAFLSENKLTKNAKLINELDLADVPEAIDLPGVTGQVTVVFYSEHGMSEAEIEVMSVQEALALIRNDVSGAETEQAIINTSDIDQQGYLHPETKGLKCVLEVAILDHGTYEVYEGANKSEGGSFVMKEEEDYKYFDEEGLGGFYLGQVKGITIYSLEDSSVMDTCMYALEGPQGVKFINIDVSGKPISPPKILKQHQLPFEIAQFLSDDINRELGEEGGDEDDFEDDLDEAAPQGTDISGYWVMYSEQNKGLRQFIKMFPSQEEAQQALEDAPTTYGQHVLKNNWGIQSAQDWIRSGKKLGSDSTGHPDRVAPKRLSPEEEKASRQRSFDDEMEREGTENKKPTMKETKLTARERRLVEMVQTALGVKNLEENIGAYDQYPLANYMRGDSDRKEEPKTQQEPEKKSFLQKAKEKLGFNESEEQTTYTEGEEMVKEKRLPRYESVEELMKEIEEGTNRVAEEHKIAEMKRIAEALRTEAKKMEESEHAQHIDPKVLKKYVTDAGKIEKAAEKLKAALEKASAGKGKKEAAPKEVEEVTLAEGFDLKKFLVENKLTTNSKMLKEDTNIGIGDIAGKFSDAGINPKLPVTYIVDYGNPAGTDPAKTTPVSTLIRQLAQEVEESEDVDVMFNTDITQGQGELLGDNLPQTEGLTCKLEVYFEDSKMYEIWQ